MASHQPSWPRFLDAWPPPNTGSVGLTRRQLLGELQVLLAYLDWRLSGVPASRTTVATPTGTSTRPDLAAPTHGPAASVIRRVTGLARRNRER